LTRSVETLPIKKMPLPQQNCTKYANGRTAAATPQNWQSTKEPSEYQNALVLARLLKWWPPNVEYCVSII
jgi:hypothetical protein